MSRSFLCFWLVELFIHRAYDCSIRYPLHCKSTFPAERSPIRFFVRNNEFTMRKFNHTTHTFYFSLIIVQELHLLCTGGLYVRLLGPSLLARVQYLFLSDLSWYAEMNSLHYCFHFWFLWLGLAYSP